MTTAPQIKGWCPSAWRPMLSGDGYLVRLHFSCGIVTSDQAHAIAALAQRYGSGQIDLTRRANLQIRGVAQEQIAALQAELLAKGLVASDAESDTPNVIASPLAGRDPQAVLDVRWLVRQLEARWAADARARGLPAKFCIAVDDGGRLSLRDVGADIAFEACVADGNICFAAQIGGSAVGFVATEEIEQTALAFAGAFVKLRNAQAPHARRMRDLVDEIGAEAVLASCPALGRASANLETRPQAVDGRAPPGREVVGLIADDVLGVAAPFGSLHADQLALVGELAKGYADDELRLTPWRAVLIPAIAPSALNRVAAECARAGLITDPSDRRRHVQACAGAPTCASASVATRDIAAALVPLLGPEHTLHVSGCAKACASSAGATITLFGRDGRFDLVTNGRASDVPTQFGLSPEEARIAIERIAAEDLADV